MIDRKEESPAAELIKLLHGDSLINPPDGGKVRQPDSQTKPWVAFGISRATWYRQGKPKCPSEFEGNYYWRQKNRARSANRSVRSVQRLAFARRYGIPEIDSLAIHQKLPAAMLEEVAKWEHEDQRRFADRLLALSADLPKLFEPDDNFRRNFNPFQVAILPVEPSELKRVAKRAFDSTLAEVIGSEAIS
jgi:hypothetical protein